MLLKTDAAGYTYTVTAVFGIGQVISVVNAGSAGSVILAGSGVTLTLAGTATTGNRTVAPGGVSTILFTSTTTAIVSGAGVT